MVCGGGLRRLYSGAAGSEDLAVRRAVAISSACVPFGDQCAVFEQQDTVGAANLCQAVGDQQCRAAFQDPAHRPLDLVFGGAVDRTGRVVDDQDLWVGQEGASDSDTLALATRKCDAALANDGVIAFRHVLDEIVRLRERRRLLDLFAVTVPRAPKAMFSPIVRENKKISCSIVAICERRLSRLQSRRSTPSINTRPSDGSKVRLSKRVSVLLPDPVWPTIATVSPGRAVNETSRNCPPRSPLALRTACRPAEHRRS